MLHHAADESFNDWALNLSEWFGLISSSSVWKEDVILSLAVNGKEFFQCLHVENVRLIILQFGGNAIPSNQNPGTIQSIVRGLREQVRFLQACAPQASFLFIGPSDMLTQTDGEWHTFPMVPYMDKLLRKMALEENIAYFSLYRWMGGAGSMMRWQEIGLAGSDGIHFTRAGARKAGNAVADWILATPDLPSREEKSKE